MKVTTVYLTNNTPIRIPNQQTVERTGNILPRPGRELLASPQGILVRCKGYDDDQLIPWGNVRYALVGRGRGGKG